MPLSYMERTEQLSTRVDKDIMRLFRHVLFKNLETEKSTFGKGALAKGVEDALGLYVQRWLETELALPVAELLRKIDIDRQFQKYIEQSGMTVYELIETAVAVYMQLPEESRKKIRQLQFESNVPVNEAVTKVLSQKTI